MRVPWSARRAKQSILKETNPEYSLNGLMLKLKSQYFGHLMQKANSLKKTLMLGRIEGRRKGVTEDETVEWHHQHTGHEFEKTPGHSEEQGSLVHCSLWGRKDSNTTTTMLKEKRLPTELVSQSRLVMSDSLPPHGLYSPWNSPGRSTEVGRLSLLQAIFPTQGSNPGLLQEGFPGGSTGKESSYNAGDLGSISVLGNPLEKGKATHSSILAWKSPWTIHGVSKNQTRLSSFHFHKQYFNVF